MIDRHGRTRRCLKRVTNNSDIYLRSPVWYGVGDVGGADDVRDGGTIMMNASIHDVCRWFVMDVFSYPCKSFASYKGLRRPTCKCMPCHMFWVLLEVGRSGDVETKVNTDGPYED